MTMLELPAPPAPAAAMPRRTALTCRQVRDETRDVKTFLFEPETPLAFRAGQYLQLRVDAGGPLPAVRCYSLSSPPTRGPVLAITVKRVPGGLVSGWLHDRLRPGDVLQADGPHGVFTREDHPAERLLFLTAGSGATPLASIARELHDRAADPDLVSVHSARTPQDVLFGAELQRIAADLPRFRALNVCEEDGPGGPVSAAPLRGRLTAGMLAAAVPDAAAREVFVCGPPGYLAAVRGLLRELGCPPDRCHEELFEAPPPVRPAPDTGTFTVEFAASGRSAVCPPGGTVLDAAEAAGVPVPTSCRVGLCGTCKSSIVSGRVDMQHQGGIRDREAARGRALLCCSRPLTDLVVDR